MEQIQQQGKEVKKVTLGLILGWGFGVLAAISGVISVFSQPITGVLILLLAAVLLPPANKFVADKFKFSISGSLKFVLVVVLLGIIGATMGAPDYSALQQEIDARPATEVQPEEIIKVSAIRLSEEYDANKVVADTKYKGKTLEISGVVNSIGKDILDTPYVTLRGREHSLFGVQCMFSKVDEPKLATLSKEQSITLRGTISGELFSNIVARGCQIIEK